MSIFNRNKKPLAPNDPNRVPKEHRELINKMYAVLGQKGYNIFEAQLVIQSLSALRNVDETKFLEAGETVAELARMVAEVKDAPIMLQAILEILGYKMTETLNKLQLDTLEFDKFNV